MGLHIHTLSKIPDYMDKDWFIYLLEYGPRDPFTAAMNACFDEMAEWSSTGNAVTVKGTTPVHFNDEVLSWHNIGGLDGEDVLPALLISTINPHVFNDFCGPGREKYKPNDKLVVIPLRKIADNSDQVYAVVRRVLKELQQGTNLSSLEATVAGRGYRQRVVDAVELKPSVAGASIDLKKLFK